MKNYDSSIETYILSAYNSNIILGSLATVNESEFASLSPLIHVTQNSHFSQMNIDSQPFVVFEPSENLLYIKSPQNKAELNIINLILKTIHVHKMWSQSPQFSSLNDNKDNTIQEIVLFDDMHENTCSTLVQNKTYLIFDNQNGHFLSSTNEKPELLHQKPLSMCP